MRFESEGPAAAALIVPPDEEAPCEQGGAGRAGESASSSSAALRSGTGDCRPRPTYPETGVSRGELTKLYNTEGLLERLNTLESDFRKHKEKARRTLRRVARAGSRLNQTTKNRDPA